MKTVNPHGCRSTLKSGDKSYTYFRIPALEEQGLAKIARLPFSIRVLVENLLRHADGVITTPEEALRLARWQPKPEEQELPWMPGRVILQDFTGVPVVVDLVAMRNAVAERGGDPKKINPVVPVDLVIDHSVQVDYFGASNAQERNVKLEYERNRERYELLRWTQQAFNNFRVVPPGTGIIHQINLEYLGQVVMTKSSGGETIAYPDTLVGTDSHTTMINALGILGWGVGGIEAEAVMLAQPYSMLAPEVVGVRLHGQLPAGTTATDLVLAMTQALRKKGVVGKFVEYFGPSLRQLSLEDRSVLSNMAPEYGATMGFFPVDDRTLEYLRFSGRPSAQVDLVERYCKAQGLFHTEQTPDPEFSDVLDFDLSQVEPNLAGPKRPQDRVALRQMKSSFQTSLRAPVKERGFALEGAALERSATAKLNGDSSVLKHGAVVIASITSCTNTSNPSLMIAAGLLAKKAVEKGLRTKVHVKTSLSPGSRVVTDYLEKSGLLTFLEQLRFHLVGYGCTTCIGNSGPLPEAASAAVKEGDLVAAAVLSGNRNFEARVNPQVKANYLASPPLVVAYALAGTVDFDFETDPLGAGKDGQPVFLRDIWPSLGEVATTLKTALRPEMYTAQYASVFEGDAHWQSLPAPKGDIYEWKVDSTYIQQPPYFDGMPDEPAPLADIQGARVLGLFGDSVTTDHISPAGSIPATQPAGLYLISKGVKKEDFNNFGSRRGNHEVMIRGTFANIRIKNQLVTPQEGGYTLYLPTGEQTTIFDAASRYQKDGTPLIILAGKEYGTGSSRDWAAKGTVLLGVRLVIAESFERIHRSNLIGMGVIPTQFKPGETAESLGLTGHEVFSVEGIAQMKPGQDLTVHAKTKDGKVKTFSVRLRVDSPAELETIRHGGILPMMARKLSAGV